jgi:hypothetical protein
MGDQVDHAADLAAAGIDVENDGADIADRKTALAIWTPMPS